MTPETNHIKTLKELRDAKVLRPHVLDSLSWAISLAEREEGRIRLKPLSADEIYNAKLCENGHIMTGIGFDEGCPRCEAPWKEYYLPKSQPTAGSQSTSKEEPEKKCQYLYPDKCPIHEPEEELPPIEALEAHKISNELHGAAHHKINEAIERSNTHSKLINQLRKK